MILYEIYNKIKKSKSFDFHKFLVMAVKIFSMTLGIFIVMVSIFMIFAILASAFDDNETQIYVYIILILAFLLFGAEGIFLILLPKFIKNKNSPNKNKQTYLPKSKALQKPSNDEAKKIKEEIRLMTKIDAINIKIDKERTPSIFDSKIGGFPYWDISMKYPETKSGKKLTLLAQINLSQLPENYRFPKDGMLQFFILDDEVYGLDDCDDYKVIYHKNINRNVSEKDLHYLEIPTSINSKSFPVNKELAVKFESRTVSMNDHDVRIDDVMVRAAAKLHITIDKNLEFWQLFINQYEYDNTQEMTSGHWLLGYPHFSQYDPRSIESSKHYNTLLFQLDSDIDNIIWGDCGTASFFINSNALSEMNFDDVFYNWDCY